MQVALDGVPEHQLPMPTDLVTMRIDKNSGKLTNRTDKTSMFEYFNEGTEPQVFVTESEIVEAKDGEQNNKAEEEIF
jgi:penicillin-binding protein 1A